MAFTTFVYDTLDVCTRLGRYIIQELLGWQDAKGKWLGTIITAGAPVFFVMQTLTDVPESGAVVAGILVTVRRKQSTARSAHAPGGDSLAVHAACHVGLAGGGRATVWMYCMSTWCWAK